MFVLCFYTIWVVMPFKILILTSALASVNQDYYKAARVDGTSKLRTFTRITLPMISPMVFYLVITGFIGAFKAYSDAVALFGTDLNAAGMNTIVGLRLRHALTATAAASPPTPRRRPLYCLPSSLPLPASICW